MAVLHAEIYERKLRSMNSFTFPHMIFKAGNVGDKGNRTFHYLSFLLTVYNVLATSVKFVKFVTS